MPWGAGGRPNHIPTRALNSRKSGTLDWGSFYREGHAQHAEDDAHHALRRGAILDEAQAATEEELPDELDALEEIKPVWVARFGWSVHRRLIVGECGGSCSVSE